MNSELNEKIPQDQTRRTFLKTVSAGVPTLRLVMKGTAGRASSTGGANTEEASEKFTSVDLTPHFNASPADFGPHERARSLGGDSARDALIRVPTGKQNLQGIFFWLGPEGVDRKSWAVLAARANSWTTPRLEIPLEGKARFICLASFCDWDENEDPEPEKDVVEKVGQHLANAVLVYEDGGEHALPIRRRFEVNSPSYEWGHLSFTALPHRQDAPRNLTDPLPHGHGWGDLQVALWDNAYGEGALGTLWVCALANPEPNRPLKALRLEATSDDPLAVCGLTLFHGSENPLRYERLSLYRLTLPEAAAEDSERWKVEVDLGVVARTYAMSEFDPEAWLTSPGAGLGERAKPARGARRLYAEVTASPAATLTLRDVKNGTRYAFDLDQVVPGRELEARSGGARVEILEPEKVWLHGQVLDSATHRPTPVRLAFRSKDGRYIPPYGHRAEINDAWFQDYGADVKLMDSSFAYVDGIFQAELPVGEVYLEMTKGFEYEAVRKKLTIAPADRELTLEIPRLADFRSRGWVTADTHVHFLSPSTAILEGQAEGLNLINLLAAQWGDLFTNVGDISHGPLTSPDGETLVWVGTENRQHILGHLALLGSHGSAVFPMSASGPGESYLGDPLWTSLADWTDACREREGLAVCAHFPYPTGEIAADIVLGKIDAVEIWPQYSKRFNCLRYLDWYRYLNCGYRLPAVAGTDKMGAYMPAGTNRAYAYLGQEEFNFANWAKAVRSGNTFVTSGPLLLFQADGHPPGGEITLGTGGGTVEVQADAKCFVPMDRLEIVLNGRVVASRQASAGAREMSLKEKVEVPGPGWLAARCTSGLGPTTQWEFKISAHTSPVYVGVPGQELFSAPAAAYMLTLIDGAQAWVENLATRPDPERLARMRKPLTDARERLHRRLHAHGVAH